MEESKQNKHQRNNPVKERLDGNKTVSKESDVGSDLEETFKNAVEKSRKVIESLEKSQQKCQNRKGQSLKESSTINPVAGLSRRIAFRGS